MRQVRKEIVRAKEAFDRGDYEASESMCLEILQTNPEFADVYCLLATIYHEKARFADAVRLFEKALEINPMYLEARMNLVVAYNDLGQYDKAQEQVVFIQEQAQEGDDSLDTLTRNRLANLHLQTAELYSQANLFWEASREYEKALSLRPRFVDIKVKLAMALRKLGRIGEAMRQLEEALRINPDYSSARVQLALTCHRAGASKRAIELLGQVIEKNPDHTPAKLYLESIRAGERIA